MMKKTSLFTAIHKRINFSKSRIFLTVLLLSILVPAGLAAAEDTDEAGRSSFSFSAGVIGAFNTRIIEQTGRSNFVFTDTLVGLQLSAITNIPNLPNFFGRLALFYPFSYSFNEVPQTYKSIIRFSVDLAAGPVLKFPFFLGTSLNLIPALHFNYLYEDRFFYITAGIGGGAQISLPMFEKQALTIQYMFTYDFLDAGSNASIEPLTNRFMHDVSISYTFF